MKVSRETTKGYKIRNRIFAQHNKTVNKVLEMIVEPNTLCIHFEVLMDRAIVYTTFNYDKAIEIFNVIKRKGSDAKENTTD